MDTHSPGAVVDDESLPKLFLGFQGRISRKTWWLYGVLALLGIAIVLNMLLAVAGFRGNGAEGLVNLLLLWPTLALSIKRWHDRDKSGWWVLVNLIPLVGWIWGLVENGFLRGTAGPNRFGPDPLQRGAP